MLVNDCNIEPVYISLNQYYISSKEFMPEGLLYYFVLDDETVKAFLFEAFLILTSLNHYMKGLES